MEPRALLGLVVAAAFLAAVGVLFVGWVNRTRPDAPPPEDDDTVHTGKMRRAPRDQKVTWSLANATDGGTLSFGAEVLRVGTGVDLKEIRYDAIERIYLEIYGPATELRIHVRDEPEAWAAWVGPRELDRVIEKLERRGVRVVERNEHHQ